MSQPIDDGDVMAMETFKKIMNALMGTDKSLESLEQNLKTELQVARGQTREALESLRQMAQEMQWRVERLESKEQERKSQGDGNER